MVGLMVQHISWHAMSATTKIMKSYTMTKPADRLALRFVFHQRAIVHKGILTEKTATSLHRPVKKVCVPGHAYVYLAIHTGTISQLGHTSRKGFTVDDKGTYNLTVVGSYVGCLRHIYYSGILNIELSPV